MANPLQNRVLQVGSGSGQNDVTLDSSSGGFKTFDTAFDDGDDLFYEIEDGNNWEIGDGTKVNATNISRDAVLDSSAGGTTKISLSGGPFNIFVTLPENRVLYRDKNGQIINGGNIVRVVDGLAALKALNPVPGDGESVYVRYFTSETSGIGSFDGGWFTWDASDNGTGDDRETVESSVSATGLYKRQRQASYLVSVTSLNGFGNLVLADLNGKTSIRRIVNATDDNATDGTAGQDFIVPETRNKYYKGIFRTLTELKDEDANLVYINDDRVLLTGITNDGDIPPLEYKWNSSGTATGATLNDVDWIRPTTGAASTGNGRWELIRAIDSTVTMTSGDATPSVAHQDVLISAGTTTITDFNDGYERQELLFIWNGTDDITISNNANIVSSDGNDLNFNSSYKSASFRRRDGVWYQISGTASFANARIANITAETELTISSGSITLSGPSHTIDTESDAATDDLTDVNWWANAPDGAECAVRLENSARAVVFKHSDAAGKIVVTNAADQTLNDKGTIVLLKKIGDRTIANFGGSSSNDEYIINSLDYGLRSGNGNWSASAWQTIIDAANAAAVKYDSVVIKVPGRSPGDSAAYYVDTEWVPLPARVNLESYAGTLTQFRCMYQPRFESYSATVSQTVFSFPHQVDATSDIVVYVMEDNANGDPVPVRQILGTDYTLSGVPGSSVNITFTSAPGAGTLNVFAYHIKYGGFINIESTLTHLKGLIIDNDASVTNGACILVHNNSSRAFGDDTNLQDLQISAVGQWDFDILYNGSEKTVIPGVRDFSMENLVLFRGAIAKLCLLTCNGGSIRGVKMRDGGVNAQYYDLIISGDATNPSNNILIDGDTFDQILLDEIQFGFVKTSSNTNVVITSNAVKSRVETPKTIYLSEDSEGLQFQKGNITPQTVDAVLQIGNAGTYGISSKGDLYIRDEDRNPGVRLIRTDDDGFTITGDLLLQVSSSINFFGVTASPLRFWTNNIERMRVEADGGVVFYNLPTSDPAVAGEIWNDSGTLKISAG